jgi:hypothetical protein
MAGPCLGEHVARWHRIWVSGPVVGLAATVLRGTRPSPDKHIVKTYHGSKGCTFIDLTLPAPALLLCSAQECTSRHALAWYRYSGGTVHDVTGKEYYNPPRSECEHKSSILQ